MMSILKKIASAKNNRTTYKVGMLQAHAYRLLKQKTGEALKPYGISTTEWALLGLLFEEKELRFNEAAKILGVEAPFVTEMVGHLSTKALVAETKDTEDTRVKLLTLSAKGKKFVADVEPVLRSAMRPLVSGATARDLLGYLAILENIIEKGS